MMTGNKKISFSNSMFYKNKIMVDFFFGLILIFILLISTLKMNKGGAIYLSGINSDIIINNSTFEQNESDLVNKY
jgi:hypothetical protein